MQNQRSRSGFHCHPRPFGLRRLSIAKPRQQNGPREREPSPGAANRVCGANPAVLRDSAILVGRIVRQPVPIRCVPHASGRASLPARPSLRRGSARAGRESQAVREAADRRRAIVCDVGNRCSNPTIWRAPRWLYSTYCRRAESTIGACRQFHMQKPAADRHRAKMKSSRARSLFPARV